MNTRNLLIGLAFFIILGALAYFLSQKPTTYAPTSVSQINEASDLNTVDSQLDEENLDTLDSELNQLDSDSSSF